MLSNLAYFHDDYLPPLGRVVLLRIPSCPAAVGDVKKLDGRLFATPVLYSTIQYKIQQKQHAAIVYSISKALALLACLSFVCL